MINLTNTNNTKFRRGGFAKLNQVTGRITFLDQKTGYVRLQRDDFWKAIGNVKNLSEPTPEEIKSLEEKTI